MKNMVLLIDANVVLDYLLEREGCFEDARRVMALCAKEHVQGYIAFHTISILWYVLRKCLPQERRHVLLQITRLLTVAGAPHDAVVEAICNEAFVDFEDALQEQCAAVVGADYIVTRNAADFRASTIAAIHPTELLQMR